MRRLFVVGVAVFLLFPVVSTAQSLVGAWTLEERVVTGGPNAGTLTASQPSLRIFTETHFSRMYVWPVNEPRPRREVGDSLSDAERLASLGSVRANTGSYELSGSTLTEHRVVAMSPVAMTAPGTFEVRLEGDSLWLTSQNPDGTVTSTEKWARVSSGM